MADDYVLPSFYPSHQDDLYPPYTADTIALPSGPIVEHAPEFDVTMTGRKLWKLTKGKSEESKGERVWPLEIEAKLIEALERYRVPNQLQQRKRFQRFPRRNQFISEYIFNTTGSVRTAKQVGSRLQQLRDSCKDPRVIRLITDVAFSMDPSSSAPAVYKEQSLAEMNTSSPDRESSPDSPTSKTAPRLTRKPNVNTSGWSSTELDPSNLTSNLSVAIPNEPSYDRGNREYYSPATEPSQPYWSSTTDSHFTGHHSALPTYSGLLSFDDTDDYSPSLSEPASSYQLSSATSYSSHSSSPAFPLYVGTSFDSGLRQESHSPPFLEPLTLPPAHHPRASAVASHAPSHYYSDGYDVKQEFVEASIPQDASTTRVYNVDTSSTTLSDALGRQQYCHAPQHTARVPPAANFQFSHAYNDTDQYHVYS